jgi:hypothetical protein
MENVGRSCKGHTTAGSYTLNLGRFGACGGVASDLVRADVGDAGI